MGEAYEEEHHSFGKAVHVVLTPPLPQRFVQLVTHRPPSVEQLAPEANSPLREAPLWGCVATMLSTIVGGGALSLPYALKLTGLGAGLPLLLASAAASDFALYALCSASRRTGTATLAELARAVQGPQLETCVVVALFVLCGFVSVAYTRLLRDLLGLFLEPFQVSARGVDVALIAVVALVLFPLALNRQVHSLRYAAFTSFGGAICVAALFTYRATHDSQVTLATLVRPPVLDSPGLRINALPIMLMLYLCQFNILSVHARLVNPTRARLKLLIHCAVGTSTLFYVVLGVAGAALCNDATLDVAQDALSCLSSGSGDDTILACAGGAFAVSILLNTPALIIPLRDALAALAKTTTTSRSLRQGVVAPAAANAANERTALNDTDDDDKEDPHSSINDKDAQPQEASSAVTHVVLTASIVIVVVIVAQRVPGVATVWAVAGSSVGLFVAFMMPCAMYLKVRGDKEGGRAFVRKMLSALLLVVAVVLAAVCTYRNLSLLAW